MHFLKKFSLQNVCKCVCCSSTKRYHSWNFHVIRKVSARHYFVYVLHVLFRERISYSIEYTTHVCTRHKQILKILLQKKKINLDLILSYYIVCHSTLHATFLRISTRKHSNIILRIIYIKNHLTVLISKRN